MFLTLHGVPVLALLGAKGCLSVPLQILSSMTVVCWAQMTEWQEI